MKILLVWPIVVDSKEVYHEKMPKSKLKHCETSKDLSVLTKSGKSNYYTAKQEYIKLIILTW